MPKRMVNGVEYNYEERGSGDQVIFFGHGLLYAWQSFSHQIDHFASQGYRCIAIDWRGQGETQGGGAPEEYSMYRLGDDAYALLRDLGVERCHWVGLSMGGMVAMRLYPKHPELFQSLVLLDTSASYDHEHLPAYTQMAETFRDYGAVPPLLEALDAVFYAPGFAERNPAAVEHWHTYWSNVDRQSLYMAVMPVIDRDDVSETVNQIDVPTLIIIGDQDYSTPKRYSDDLNQRIAGSQLVVIPNAAHMSSVEQPEAVTQAMDTFFSSLKG